MRKKAELFAFSGLRAAALSVTCSRLKLDHRCHSTLDYYYSDYGYGVFCIVWERKESMERAIQLVFFGIHDDAGRA
jgi:hypothetical protein